MPDPDLRDVRRGRGEVVDERRRHQVPRLVVHVALVQRGGGAVREAAEHLSVGERRVEEQPGVVDRDVLEHVHDARRPVDLDRADVHDQPVRGRGGDPILVVGWIERRRRPEGDGREAGLLALWQPLGVPVGHSRHAPQRERVVPGVLADRVDLGTQLRRRGPHRTDGDAGEAGRVVARRNAPGDGRRVHLGEHRHVRRVAAEHVRDHLRADRAVALALRRRGEPDRDAAEGIDQDRRALGVAGLRQRLRALGGGLGECDVAHVRDRRLDDAGDPDPGEAPVRPRGRHPLTQLVVADELERAVEACLVVAGVVERSGRRPVGHRVRRDQVPSRELGRVEPEPARGDRHRALEREVELRAAEAAVEAGRDRVREDDAVARGHVLDAVRAGEGAVHAVEGRRLGCADVGTDVLDRVVAQRGQAAVRREPGLHGRRAPGRGCARGEVLEPVLDPADGDAEVPRGEPDEDHVCEDGRLDPEGAARVGWGEEAEAVASQSKRRGRDAVQRERPLEVRPRGEPAGACVPVGHDGVALDRRAREAREDERLSHDEVGRGQRRVDVAVGERAVVDRVGSRDDGVEDGVERVVVDLDELGRVLGEVAALGHDDRERLAHVPCRVDRGGVLRHARVDPGREGARERGDVGAGEHADDALGRRRRQPGRPRSVRGRAGSVRSPRGTGARRGRGRRGSGPRRGAAPRLRRAAGCGRPRVRAWFRPPAPPGANLPPFSAGGVDAARSTCSSSGPPSSSARNASSTARGSRLWRSAAIVSGSRTAPPQWAQGQWMRDIRRAALPSGYMRRISRIVVEPRIPPGVGASATMPPAGRNPGIVVREDSPVRQAPAWARMLGSSDAIRTALRGSW